MLGPFAAFALTDVLVCLTPGPAVLCVVTQALGHGPRRALWANAGILAGDACYVALAALGVGALLAASPDLLRAVQYAGAAYLAGLGVATWRGRGGSVRAEAGPPGTGPRGAGPPARAAGPAALARGFATQAANPKALLFFTALLPQFIRSGAPLGPQIAVLGVLAAGIEGLVLLGYGALAGRVAPALGRPRVRRAVDRAAGGLLVAAGVRTAIGAA